jgi:hypothetical protein
LSGSARTKTPDLWLRSTLTGPSGGLDLQIRQIRRIR